MKNEMIEKLRDRNQKLTARNCVIVSRHPAAIEWLKSKASGVADLIVWEPFGDYVAEDVVPIITGNATAGEVAGKYVIGNLPLSLAAVAREVWAIEFGGNPPRGSEYGVSDMIQAGAWMACYTVKSTGEAEGSLESRSSYRRDLDGPYAGH